MMYHKPVLLEQSIEGLNIKSDGIYVDATFGGGGHSRYILEKLGNKGRLIGFDQDNDAKANVPDDPRFDFVLNNFRYLRRYLKLFNLARVDGILADLGVSSHQLDTGERGFSFGFDASMDMRMDPRAEQTASDILNTYKKDQLQKIFSKYGEVRNAKTLASALAIKRDGRPLEAIGDLIEVLDQVYRGNKNRYFAQVFQALRMEVNDEIGALEELLENTLNLLGEGGRLVIMSYHSVEDRLVKNFMKTGNTDGQVQQDDYGNIHRPFKLITKKPIFPSELEIASNPRARSARLRIAEKNG